VRKHHFGHFVQLLTFFWTLSCVISYSLHTALLLHSRWRDSRAIRRPWLIIVNAFANAMLVWVHTRVARCMTMNAGSVCPAHGKFLANNRLAMSMILVLLIFRHLMFCCNSYCIFSILTKILKFDN